MSFKKGDIAMCIKTSPCGEFTAGKVYTVNRKPSTAWITCLDNSGDSNGWASKNFVHACTLSKVLGNSKIEGEV